MSTALVKRKGLELTNMDDMGRFAKAAVASGLLVSKGRDASTAVAEAIVKMQYGAEFGLAPMQAIQAIQVISGKPTLSAGAIASLIKSSGKYNYRIRTHTEALCEIEFFEDKESVGMHSFSLDDARSAGLLNNPTWKKYPRNMLFARCVSNGARWYCPDVFGGSVYETSEIEQVEAKVVESGRLRVEALLDDETVDPETGEVG